MFYGGLSAVTGREGQFLSAVAAFTRSSDQRGGPFALIGIARCRSQPAGPARGLRKFSYAAAKFA